MNHVCMAAVVMVAVLGGSCEGGSIRPNLVGLLNAEEIQAQFDLLDTLLERLANGSDCDIVKQAKEDDEAKEVTETQFEVEKAPVAPVEEECDYGEIHADHTMLLPPNDECDVKKTGITDEDKELILKMHNELRAKVAKGNESLGLPGPQPSAARMHQLIWNEELAKIAQAWALQCPTGHDVERKRRLCSRKYRTGQNINYHWGSFDKGSLWQTAIENWYSEVKDVDNKSAAAFPLRPPRKIGHYTQLVWGTTTEVGCGTVYYETVRKGITYTHSITHVCNYGPAGNVVRRPLYEHGEAASNCPDGVSVEYPALCL